MKKILERVFNLIRKTGDRVIIVNSENTDSYVVMNLDQYEKMIEKSGALNLTGGEAVDKINQDIASWREEEKKKEAVDLPDIPIASETPDNNEEENQFYFEPVE